MDAPLSVDGSLFFDDTGETLGPTTTPLEFTRTRLAQHGNFHLAPVRSTCRLEHRLVHGTAFIVTLQFADQAKPRLTGVELFLCLPDDAKDWSGWSLEQELKRKALGEAWIARTFGKAPGLMSFDIDGTRVTPPETDESARHAVFAWGEFASYYDSKGGSAYLRLKYS